MCQEESKHMKMIFIAAVAIAMSGAALARDLKEAPL
jgi:hypothetical protein